MEIFTQANRRPRVVLLRGARQLVTLRGEPRPRRGAEMHALGIIQDGALLIVDGVIREVGPSRRVERLAEAQRAIEIDASGKVVMPGFIDCLAQPLHPLPHSEEFPVPCGPSGVVKPLSAQRLETEGRRRMRQFLQQGTLAVAAMAGLDGDERAALRELRTVRDLAMPTALFPSTAGHADSSHDFLQRVRHENLAALAALDATGTQEAQARETARHAKKLGYAIQVKGNAQLSVEAGACMAHGLQTPEVHNALRESAVVVASCPARDLLVGGEPEPLRQRIDDGLAVAIATGFGLDGCTVSSLPAAMTLACLHSRMSPPEAITAATINAAFALNAADRIGSLAPGKFADLLLLDAGDYREICLQLGSNLVHSVMRRGEWQDLSSTTPPLEPLGSSARAS